MSMKDTQGQSGRSGRQAHQGVAHRPTPGRFSLAGRCRSFGHAFDGLMWMMRTQHNAWLHLVAAVMVLSAAALLGVGADDWRWLIAAITMVWGAEAMNTAVEFLCDVVSPQYQLAVKHAKDIAAGGVLIAACGAAAIGLLTFWPHVLARWPW